MRVLKVAGLALIVVMLSVMWQRRAWVTSAYTDEAEQIEFDGRGVDLSFEPAVLDSTSFEMQLAPNATDISLTRFESSPSDDEVAIWGGRASMTGTVFGPEGPVAGATVVVERFVDSRRAEVRVQTDEFGTWSVNDAFGGAYRVRAFSANELVSPPSEVLFISDASATVFNTTLQAHVSATFLSVSGGVTLHPGQDQTVAVVASTTVVDGEGRVVVVPIANTPITATVSGVGTLISATTVVTDSGGAARFRIRCEMPGAASFSGSGESKSVSVALPACVPVPEPEPEPEPEPVAEDPAVAEESP